MRTRGAFLLLPLLVTACAREESVGVRYRCEREIWRIEQEVRRLSIKPELVEEKSWRALAERYETLAEEHAEVRATESTNPQDETRREIRTLVARSLVSAARLRAMVGDSVRMAENYDRVTAGFQDLPVVVAAVALAQGTIAESRGEEEEAAASYQRIVDRIEPRPGDPDVPGVVLELPLRIARLRAKAAAAASTGAGSASALATDSSYEAAVSRYASWIAEHPGSRIEMEARLRLADLASDQRRWQEALNQVRFVEAQVSQMKEPPFDPGGVRLTTALVQDRAAAPRDAIRSTLLSLLEDYPESAAAPQALLTLANQSASMDSVNDALGYLDQLRDEYPDAERLVAEGMLLRGRILEKEGRWSEALGVFRTLPVQHPLSEAALQAPLEIVAHYNRLEKTEETTAALTRAEQAYRDVIDRYPPGESTVSARKKLVQTLVLQKRFEEAIAELLVMGDALQRVPQGAGFMLEAARLAQNGLGNTVRASEILERLGSVYPNMEIGRWASAEAIRLREANSE